MISWESISSEKTPEERLAEEEAFQCRCSAVQYASGRKRSSGAIRSKLKEKGYPSDLIEQTLIDIEEDHYVHDDALAVSLVKERRGRKSEGHTALRERMRRLGIRESAIADALEQAVDETTLLKEFLGAHCSELIDEWLNNQDNYVDSQKTLAKLIRKAEARAFKGQAVLEFLRSDHM